MEMGPRHRCSHRIRSGWGHYRSTKRIVMTRGEPRRGESKHATAEYRLPNAPIYSFWAIFVRAGWSGAVGRRGYRVVVPFACLTPLRNDVLYMVSSGVALMPWSTTLVAITLSTRPLSSLAAAPARPWPIA